MSPNTTIGIRLALDGAQQAEAGLRRVSGGMEQLGASAANVKNAMAGLAGALAGAVSVQQFVQAADAVTTLNNQLKLATGSTQAAGKAYAELFDIAQRSRVSFTELGSTFASISRAGQELGVSQSRLLTVTEAIGNAMTVSGGSAASMQAALTQLGQGLASGTLRGEELNSVMEQTPRLAKALADGLGVPIGKLREMGAAGEITAQQVIKALESQAKVLQGEVQGAVLTVGQAMTVLQNATVKTVGEFDKASGASASLAQAIGGLASGVSAAGKAFADNEAAIKTTLGVLAGAGVAVGITRAGAALGAVATGVGGVAGALTALKVVVAGLNPVTLGLLGLGAVVGGVSAYNSAQEKTADGIRRTIAALEEENRRGPSIYGRSSADMAAFNAAVDERNGKIKELRAQLSLMNASSLDTRAEDARIQAHVAAAKATGADAKAYDDLRIRLSAFRGDFGKYQADLKRIQEGMASGAIPEQEGVAMLTELAKRHGEVAKAATWHKNAIDPLTESARESAKAWADRVGDFQKLAAASLADAENMTKAEEALKKYLESAAYLDDVAKGRQNEVLAAAALALENERLAASSKAVAIAEADRAKTEQALIDAAEKSTASVQEKLQSLKDEESALVIAAANNISLAQAIEEVEIARLREQQAALMREGDRDSEVLAIQREIDARKKLQAAIGSKESREAGDRAAKDVAAAWQRASDDIERSLTDALMRGFESGKDFVRNLRDTAVNLFKTLVFRPVISAVVSPVAGAITSSLGLPGAANAATSAGNLMGAGAGLYNSFATSSVGGALGLSVPYVDVLGAGAAQSGILTSAGSSIGAALPWIGGILAVASLIKSLDKGGTFATGGAARFSASGGVTTASADELRLGNALGTGFADSVIRGDQATQAAVAMSQTIAGILDATAVSFGRTAGYEITTAFASDSVDGAWGSLIVRLGDRVVKDWGSDRTSRWAPREFANGEAGAKEYAAAVAKDVRDYLLTQTPDWADAMLSALGDTPTLENLSAVVGQINQAAAALDGMGRASKAFAGLSESATAALIKAIGGAEAATASLASYYDNFYSEQERTALATARLTEQLAALGLALPTTREAFRGLVDAALAAGNTDLAASLLNLSGAFAAIQPAAQATATAVAEAAQSIQRERAGLERQLLQATGNTAALRALDLAALDESNRALQLRIWALQNEATALQTTRDISRQAQEAARQSAATMLGALEQSNQFFAGIQRNIASFVAGLDAQAGGQPGLRSAASAYSAQLAFARGGDQDALQGITGYAQTYIEAIRRESTTAAEAALQLGRVRGQLLALPGQVKPEDAIVAAIGALGETLTASFDNIDLNVSGLIDYTEFSRAFTGMASDATLKEIFSLLDTNGDGTISRLEAIKGTSLQTAENTYGLDKLARVKDVIDSLNWGTAEWDAASARTLSTVASQQGWTAQDLAQALNGRFTPEQLVQFFRQQGQNLALGGLGGFGSRTPAGGSQATTPAPGGGFVVGGGNAGASAGAANYGSAGEIQAVFAQAYINSLSWGNPQADASSTAALASYASSAGLTQADLADLLGFTPEQIQQHFAAYGIPAFAVGTNYVPRDMLALIHEGEAVVPKAYNPVAGGMDFSAFGRGMDAMAAEVRALREDNQAQARAMVQLQQRLVKLQERWDANGLPETRVEA